MNWLDKKRDEVLRKWRNNEVSMADAVTELVWLGYTPNQAWSLLANT